MNSSLGATIPSSQFNFFGADKSNGGFSSINSNKSQGDLSARVKHPTISVHATNQGSLSFNKQLSNKQMKQDDKPHRKQLKGNKNMKIHIKKSDDDEVGSLLSDPTRLGFQRINHKLRPMPKFLIGQQPQLKSQPFVQDPWDRANQDKMLKLEGSIDDVTDLYETLKKMREMERKMMENKGLVDKADSAKDLTDAINFRGTCLDMCPIFERARRNVEYTVYSYEKEDPNGKKASRSRALKVFARPAAAAAPPLPSDVRPPHILSQTLDYIVDNLLPTLPDSEGFIWDRMRSIRQDFTYQNYSGPEAVDCNERIVRIHLLIIHVMSKSSAEFSLQQELEQLHKSLITLSEIYDEVRANGGHCPNEAEFRAYALLSKIRDPEYDKNIQELPTEIFQDELVQIALCFRRMISNSNFSRRGYIRTENCLNFYDTFFQVINSGKVPFLMSSFLELYVNEVRFYGFKALSLSINKRHKPIPIKHLIEKFLFNDRQELEQFCKYYSIDVTDEGVELKTLTHHSHKLNETQPLKQACLDCVDRMLNNMSPTIIINSGQPNSDSLPSRAPPSIHVDSVPQNEIEEDEVEEESQERMQSREKNKIVQTKEDATVTTFPTADRKIFQGVSFNPQASAKAEKSGPHQDKIYSATVPSIQIQSPQVDFVPNALPQSISCPAPIATKNEKNLDTRHISGGVPIPVSQIFAGNEERNLEGGTLKTENEAQIEHNRLEVEKRELGVEMERKLNETKITNEITNSIVEKVVHDQVGQLISGEIEKYNTRKSEINKLTKDLYYAFLHEKIYEVYLESTAEVFHEKKLKASFLSRLEKIHKIRKEIRDRENKRKAEFHSVGRQLGAPLPKRSKVISTPRGKTVSSFVLPSSLRKDITLSPVFDEENIFSGQAEKRTEVWEPLDMKRLYFEPLVKKCEHMVDSVVVEDIFIYASNWISVPNNWVMSKFGICQPTKPATIGERPLSMTIRCIDSTYDPSLFTNVQLLVFNTGVTESNIFDLEMKLQQDGEDLIKLVTGISLNTNIMFSILILYWESTETPLSDSTIFKCLKLNRISKSFSSVLQNISIITISGNSPHEELKEGLIKITQNYNYALTERGRYHTSLQQRRSLAGLKVHSNTTHAIDDKMRSMLESEESKYKKEEDQRNTYAHLKSHVAASPRLEKKKLPVLLSKSKEYKFKTPLAIRSMSSSSYAIPSHLATKIRRAPRVPSYHGVLPGGTPSHSTNLPGLPVSTGCLLNTSTNAPDNSQLSNLSYEHPTVIHEPALYQTPINSAVHSSAQQQAVRNSPTSSVALEQHDESIPQNILELKHLIESVKRKVNHE